MSNQWFRMYHEFATDPKVQMLSEANQRRYIMLLCLKCCNGDVTLQDEEIAFQLRISNDEWLQTKAILQAKNLITENASPTAWDKRQFASDSSAARVAKHRERKKQKCNVTVTPPESESDSELKEKDKSFSSPEKKISGPVFIELPLNEKMKTHAVTEPDIERFRELYPAVDIPQELRNMRGWLDANPAKRKTASGIQRFITAWLAKVQNSGGSKSFTHPQAQQSNGLPPGYKYFGGQA